MWVQKLVHPREEVSVSQKDETMDLESAHV